MKLGDPCPRCNCQMVQEFKCGCGDVHADCCENCGRYVTLCAEKANEIWEGALFGECGLGDVMHRHSPTPKEYLMGNPTTEEFKKGVLLDENK